MNFVSTKNKARRRKKEKAGKGREVYYLENTAMADSTNDIEICTVTSRSLPAETSPIKQKANQMTASTECIASSSVCGRERTWSRSSAAPVLHSTDFYSSRFQYLIPLTLSSDSRYWAQNMSNTFHCLLKARINNQFDVITIFGQTHPCFSHFPFT